jgi:parallel beta-helix repeat protein
MKVKMTFAVLALAGMLLVLSAPAAAESSKSSKVVEVQAGESIQAAIDAADPGTTIKIEEGTYEESLQISKDGIKLVGEGKDETHIVPPDPLVPGVGCVFEDAGVVSAIGICVNDPGAQPPVRIDGVKISHLSVTGFNGMGIFLFAVDNPVVKHVNASDDGEYGIFSLASSGTRLYKNVTNNDGEAGIYVGSSENADAVVKKNSASGSTLGIFIRDAANGLLVKNKTFGNCVGILFLNTDESPDPQQDVANWVALKNRVTENNKACPPSEEGPPLSGVGILVLGGVDISLIANHVLGNNAGSNPSAFTGGISINASPFGAAPIPSTGTRVAFNTALGNNPDLFWDGLGDGNVFVDNECETSDPAGLCDEEGEGNGNGNGDGNGGKDDDDADDDKSNGKPDHAKGDDDDDDDHDGDRSSKGKGKNGKQHSKDKDDRDDDD